MKAVGTPMRPPVYKASAGESFYRITRREERDCLCRQSPKVIQNEFRLDAVAVAAAHIAAGAESENQDKDVGQENQADEITDAVAVGCGQVVV